MRKTNTQNQAEYVKRQKALNRTPVKYYVTTKEKAVLNVVLAEIRKE